MGRTRRQRLVLLCLGWGAIACKGDTGPVLPPCTAAGFDMTLLPGQYVAFNPAAADSGCAVFPGNASLLDSAEYLLVPQLATGVPGRTSGFRLSGDTILPAPPPAPPARSDLAPAERFHAFLRDGDASRWRGLVPRPVAVPRRSTTGAVPPVPGSIRAFKVCARLDCSRFDDVTATARVVKSKVAIYVDNAAPPGGLTDPALDSLATLFDTRLYAVDTAAFGRESDIDGNGVVMVLMTSTVNRLVTSAQCVSSGFVAGFFYSLDLFSSPNSNNGEVFYSIVPDPAGTLSCSHSTDQVKRIIPVTFIHEFQHMISFNQHVLVNGGDGEVLWLNEALSHFAEELGGRSFGVGTPDFSRFAIGNVFNAYNYLDSTRGYFLLPSEGLGSLAERGASWLFVRYLVDRYAGDTSLAAWSAFTRGLVETTLTGAANVAAEAGDPFETIVTRWALANWVSDLPGFTAPTDLQYDSWNFRTTFASLNAQDQTNFPKTYPLTPSAGAGRAVDLSGTLRGGSGIYHRALLGPGEAGFTLLFGTSGGGPLDPAFVPRLNVIRIR